MEKIPTLFERDWAGDRSRVLDAVVPGCEWVLAGEGVATRKYDGTCCLVRDRRLYKRHEVREGKSTPEGFEKVEADEATGKVIGWIPVGDGPEDKWHRQAWEVDGGALPDGTYELLGPKIQGNPERFPSHELLRHAAAEQLDDLADLTYVGIMEYLADEDIEGIVWHHPDGRMAKIKKRDFGLKR